MNFSVRKISQGLLLAAALGLLALSPAFAKDYKAMPSFETGGRWFFAYDKSAKDIRLAPGFAYGGTYTQIIDFDWARNMAFEANYLHSVSGGKRLELDPSASTTFHLTADTWCANIGYFFIGRKVLPYISGGFGFAALKYEPVINEDKLWEQTAMMNLGGGVDWTVWEPEKSRALDRILLGARVRYEYLFVSKTFDSSLNALTVTGRAELRF